MSEYFKNLIAQARTEVERTNPKPPPPPSEVDQALEVFESGDPVAALPLLIKGLKAAPNHPAGLAAICRIIVERGHRADAGKVLTRELGQGPKNPLLFFHLGEVHMAREDRMLAAAAYREAVTLNPKFTDAHLGLGLALYGDGQFAAAQAAFQRAVLLDRSALSARHHVALCALELEDFAHALAQIHWMKETNPTFAPAYLLQAGLYERESEYVQAIEEYRSYARLEPTDATPHWRIGRIELALKNKEEALAGFQQAAILQPDMWEAHFYCGRILEGLGRHEEAITCFVMTTTINADMWDAYAHAGRLQAGLRIYVTALANFRAIAHVPRYREEAAMACERIGHFLKAVEASMAGTGPLGGELPPLLPKGEP